MIPPPILLLSPAKTLNFDSGLSSAIRAMKPTKPRFLGQAHALADQLAKLPKAQLKQLMGLSDSLAALNHARYTAFATQGSRVAIGAFEGAAYKGLDAATLEIEDLEYLSSSLRILCGQYGVLTPADEIRPYRLEMSTKLAMGEASNLYQHWKERITDSLRQELLQRPGAFVLNVASQEYAKAVDMSGLEAAVITAVFPGPAVHAKMARGEMVRFCARNKVTSPSALTAFTGTGGEWKYVESASSETEYVFHRSAGSKKGGSNEVNRARQPPAKRARK